MPITEIVGITLQSHPAVGCKFYRHTPSKTHHMLPASTSTATTSQENQRSSNRVRSGPTPFNVRDDTTHVVAKGGFISSVVAIASFGPQLDRFLDLWGFQGEVIRHLENAWKNAENQHDFVQRMVKRGMGYREAEWFWEQIRDVGGVQGQRPRAILRREHR